MADALDSQFNVIAGREYGGLLRVAARILGSGEHTQDVVQDALMIASRRFKSQSQDLTVERLGSEMKRIVVSLATRALSGTSGGSVAGEDIADEGIGTERSATVNMALGTMCETEKTIAEGLLDELTYDEIAKSLGVTRGTFLKILENMRDRLGKIV